MTPNVELVTDTTNACEAMAFAARMCYNHEQKKQTYNEACDLLQRVLARKHYSILEHAILSFYITGVSRNFTHQLVRHRHMSFAQQSFHYTVATDKEYPEHPVLPDGANGILKVAFDAAFRHYNNLIKLGVPKEEARHVLPSGISTKIYATANLREWMQFVNIRICSVNCYEIQEVARQVLTHINDNFVFMRHHLGPNCYLHKTCNEGKKFCGKPWSTLK